MANLFGTADWSVGQLSQRGEGARKADAALLGKDQAAGALSSGTTGTAGSFARFRVSFSRLAYRCQDRSD